MFLPVILPVFIYLFFFFYKTVKEILVLTSAKDLGKKVPYFMQVIEITVQCIYFIIAYWNQGLMHAVVCRNETKPDDTANTIWSRLR